MREIERILRLELSATDADRVLARMHVELQGLKIAFPQRPKVTTEDILRALERCSWRVDDAARELCIHPSAVWRLAMARPDRRPQRRADIR